MFPWLNVARTARTHEFSDTPPKFFTAQPMAHCQRTASRAVLAPK